MNSILRLALFLLALIQLASPTVSVQLMRGQCVGCNRPFKLNRFQFVTPIEGWATGFYIVVSEGHVSQFVLSCTLQMVAKPGCRFRTSKHTAWMYEPAFSFINAQEGWIGWTTASEPMDHMIRTTNGGRGWIKLAGTNPGLLAHLRFFDSHLGYSAISTIQGPQLGVTRDGGKTWSFRKEPREAGLIISRRNALLKSTGRLDWRLYFIQCWLPPAHGSNDRWREHLAAGVVSA